MIDFSRARAFHVARAFEGSMNLPVWSPPFSCKPCRRETFDLSFQPTQSFLSFSFSLSRHILLSLYSLCNLKRQPAMSMHCNAGTQAGGQQQQAARSHTLQIFHAVRHCAINKPQVVNLLTSEALLTASLSPFFFMSRTSAPPHENIEYRSPRARLVFFGFFIILRTLVSYLRLHSLTLFGDFYFSDLPPILYSH